VPRPVNGTPLPRLARSPRSPACRLTGAGRSRVSTVILGYQVLKPVPRTLHVMVRALLGVRDLRDDLHQNMTTSLGKIAEIAAGQEPGRPSAATARTS
jgi:hypothetical protein